MRRTRLCRYTGDPCPNPCPYSIAEWRIRAILTGLVLVALLLPWGHPPQGWFGTGRIGDTMEVWNFQIRMADAEVRSVPEGEQVVCSFRLANRSGYRKPIPHVLFHAEADGQEVQTEVRWASTELPDGYDSPAHPGKANGANFWQR